MWLRETVTGTRCRNIPTPWDPSITTFASRFLTLAREHASFPPPSASICIYVELSCFEKNCQRHNKWNGAQINTSKEVRTAMTLVRWSSLPQLCQQQRQQQQQQQQQPFHELSESSVSVEDMNSDANEIDGVTGADCVAIIEGSRQRTVLVSWGFFTQSQAVIALGPPRLQRMVETTG